MAIALCPDLDIVVEWKPFFLKPYTPIEGTPKAPDTPQNPRVGAVMKAAGQAVVIVTAPGDATASGTTKGDATDVVSRVFTPAYGIDLIVMLLIGALGLRVFPVAL